MGTRPAQIAPTVALGKVRLLGRVGRFDYGVISNVEFVIEPELSEDIHTWAPRPGMVLISVPREARDGERTLVIGTGYRRAFEVEKGTFEGLKRAQETAKGKQAKRGAPRPVDLASDLSALRGKSGTIYQFGAGDRLDRLPLLAGQDPATLGSLDGLLRGVRPAGIMTADVAPVSGPRGFLAQQERKGFRHVAVNGRLEVHAPNGRADAGVRAAYAFYQQRGMLTGIVSGDPVPCDHGCGEGWTIVLGGAVLCEQLATARP